jgi:hypothetical protein
MKRIINGKKYDTETALCRAEYQRNYINDHNYLKEELYEKLNGEFFLAGKGGGNTKYCKSDGNTRCAGEKIIPLSHEEAKAWMEEYVNEDYEAIFGDVEE